MNVMESKVTTPHCLHQAQTKTLKALVVEDNRMIQMVHKSFLKQLGFDVQIASNGTEAIHMYSPEHCLILLDINLPDIDGTEVSRIIRNNPGGRHVQIIALTAYNRDEVENRCLAAGINKILTKPVMFQQLQGSLLDEFEGAMTAV